VTRFVPPGLGTRSTPFGCQLPPDCDRADHQHAEKYAGSLKASSLIRESERAEEEGDGNFLSRNPRTREPRERGPRCSAKRSKYPVLGGSLRTAACSLGANAPSLRVVGPSERSPSPRRRGAVLGLAGGSRNEMIPGKVREHEMTRNVSRSLVALPTIVGERTSASDLVDGLGAPAVYGRITFANASAAQALMALTLDVRQPMSCTPHWQAFRENWGRGRHD